MAIISDERGIKPVAMYIISPWKEIRRVGYTLVRSSGLKFCTKTTIGFKLLMT